MTRWRGAAACGLSLLLSACTGAPWFMGQPRTGTPSIPATDETPRPSRLRQRIAAERAAGARLAELWALERLVQAAEPTVGERARLGELRGEQLRVVAAAWGAPAASRAPQAWAELVAGVAVSPWVAGVDLDASRWDAVLGEGPMRVERARSLADALVDEAPTQPAAHLAAGWFEVRAGQTGVAARHFRDAILVSAPADRPRVMAKVAEHWQRAGHPRRACGVWAERARWVDDASDPAWDALYRCALTDPGLADPRAIREAWWERTAPDERPALQERLTSIDASTACLFECKKPADSR